MEASKNARKQVRKVYVPVCVLGIFGRGFVALRLF